MAETRKVKLEWLAFVVGQCLDSRRLHGRRRISSVEVDYEKRATACAQAMGIKNLLMIMKRRFSMRSRCRHRRRTLTQPWKI